MPLENNTKTSSDIEHVDWSTGTGSAHQYNVRFGSGSSQASQSSGDICRICHCESDPQNPLLTPCYCAGSLKYVHQTCLQQWLTASETNSCELCKFPFIMHTKIKPFNEWRSLDISGIERRRLCCSVLFHCAAALCVIWSLCVLIERAADDVQRGLIDWPFWTKLAVVAVGLTGGVVFMYIQCKAYLHLCHRWKARNRILLIQNAPEKVHPLSPPSPATQQRSHHGASNEARSSSVCGTSTGGAMNVAANAYNYSAASAIGAGGDVADGARLHQHYQNLTSSPHCLMDHGDLDMDPMMPRTSSGIRSQMQDQLRAHHMAAEQQQHQTGQVAVAANIECSQSQHNYERDYALDDVVSQISSFRPCPQGSGSMTPFHDSIHNVLEHSEDSSRVSVTDLCVGSRQDLSADGVSSDTGREHAMQLSSFSGSGEQKAPSISSGVSHAVANGLGGFVYKPHTKRYSNSSIFIENRDILNDSVVMESDGQYLKHDYRHSSVLTPAEGECDQLEQYLGRDLRRYSDTKLLGSVDAEAHNPMLGSSIEFNASSTVATPTTITTAKAKATATAAAAAAATATTTTSASNALRMPQLLKQHSDSGASRAMGTVLDMELPISPLSPPAYVGSRPALRRSLRTVEIKRELNAPMPGPASENRQIDRARLSFKSLPNLSGSCESLIKK